MNGRPTIAIDVGKIADTILRETTEHLRHGMTVEEMGIEPQDHQVAETAAVVLLIAFNRAKRAALAAGVDVDHMIDTLRAATTIEPLAAVIRNATRGS